MTASASARSTLQEKNILFAFLAFIIVGGGASVAVRITYGELAPFWSASARFGLAALIFWLLVLMRRIPLPRGRALLGALTYGVLTIGLTFVLISWGLVATPASTYQILIALVPLLTLFLSAAHGLESITRKGLFGSLLAVVGIAITVGGASAADLSLPHIVAILFAAVFLAEGGVLLKRFPPNPPLMTNAIGLTIGAIILMIASLVTGETWTIPTQTNTWIAFIYLVIFVTVVAFMLYVWVLSKWTASGTSYGFVLVPLVTIVLAATLVGETITLNFVFGALFVLSGVLIGALLPSKKKAEAVEECKDSAGQVLPHCG